MLYQPDNLRYPSSLVYSWAGWPLENTSFATALPDPIRTGLADAWKADGLSLRAMRMDSDQVQATFTVEPGISPVSCAQRAKGRLQHALRSAGLPCAFSRKASVRALGHNLTPTVSTYVRNQLAHVDLADPRYRDELARNAFEDPSVDLDQPFELKRSRYWYSLHLVLVTAERYRMGGDLFLGRLRAGLDDALRGADCRPRAIALMPDHVHLAVKGNPALSPMEIGLRAQNESAVAAGCRLWQDAFYVGTFSSYDLRSIQA